MESAVTDRVWSARGRQLDWCQGPLPGNPRCCVRVCQSPVLTGALAGGASLSHQVRIAAAGGGRAHESTARAR
jgi:hypothetical protein